MMTRTMTAARFLSTCCLVLILVSCNCLVNTENDRKLLRARAREAPIITSQSFATPLPSNERRLKHHDKDGDADNEDVDSIKDDIMDNRPVITAKAAGDEDVEELSLDEAKAEEALDEEEEAIPTPAPHHSHHGDKKDKKKDSTPESTTPGSLSPSPTTRAPKEKDERASDTAGNDETATTEAPGGDDDDEEDAGNDTPDENNKPDEDEHAEEEHGNDDFDEQVPTDDTTTPAPPEHTKKPVAPTDDDDEKTPSMDDDLATRNDDELEEELHEEETEAKVFGGFGFLIAIVAMIFTAHQMSENPDGIYASVCRLAITIVSCVVKAILMPFRSLFGHRYHGSHMQLSTTEPYRSHAMELT